LTRELKIIGKYNSSCAIISLDLWLKPYPDGKDNKKNIKSNNETRYFILKIIPLSVVCPMQYYIDIEDYAINWNAIMIQVQNKIVQTI